MLLKENKKNLNKIFRLMVVKTEKLAFSNFFLETNGAENAHAIFMLA